MTGAGHPASGNPGSDDAVGLVTVTYSSGRSLSALLDSVAGSTRRPVQVVLADNGSTDGSVETAASRTGVQLLRTGSNLGYGAAANAGVAVLGSAVSWILVVNPDVVLGPGSIDALLAVADRYPTAAAFGPLITTTDGVVYPSARQLPSVTSGIGHAMFGWWWPANPWTRRYRQDNTAPVERVAGWLSGSCLLLRRTAFDEIGGFDPGYFMYFEDVDLGYRLARAGWSSVYCPSSRVTHEGGHSTEKVAAAMADAHHRSAYRYLSRRYSAPWQAPLRLVLRAGLAARAVLSKRFGSMAGGAELPDRRAS